MKHHWVGRLCVGWVNLNNDSRKVALKLAEKIAGCIDQAEHPDAATADALFQFNLSMLGMEIAESGLGFEPKLGDIICPRPLDGESWQMPAYIVPMNI